MSRSPHEKSGSKRYEDAWRAINVLIRSDGSWSGRERNTCYLNQRNGRFRDVSFVSGLDFPVDGRSFVTFDMDHDGDLDLALKSRNSPQLQILRNDISANRSLIVSLTGARSNRSAIGARALLQTNQRTLTRVVQAGSGFLSQSSRRLHFGLLPDERPLRFEIVWPGGLRERFADVPDGGIVQILEGRAEIVEIPASKPVPVPPRSLPAQKVPGAWLLEPLPAPDFSLDDLQGRKHQLSDYRGRKVLINFWATWCPPCRRELNEFSRRSATFTSEGIQVLAVSLDEELAKVRDFASGLKPGFPILLADRETAGVYSTLYRHLFDRWRDLPVPVSFLVDERGGIIKVYTGATSAEAILSDCRSKHRSAIPFAGTWHSKASGRNYVEVATALAERGLISSARELFQAALESGRSGKELYNNFAALLLEEEKLDQAQELLQKSLEIDAEQYEARLNLGLLLLKRGQPREALPSLKWARVMRPDDVLALSSLGSAHFQTGQLEEAERNYRECVRLESSKGEHYFNLGSVLASARRLEEALEAFARARELGLASVELMNSLGILYVETGKPHMGRAALEEALRMDPARYESYLNLAIYFMRSGEPDQALAWVEKAQKIDPNRPEASILKKRLLAPE